jgi:hypothetical protein
MEMAALERGYCQTVSPSIIIAQGIAPRAIARNINENQKILRLYFFKIPEVEPSNAEDAQSENLFQGAYSGFGSSMTTSRRAWHSLSKVLGLSNQGKQRKLLELLQL